MVPAQVFCIDICVLYVTCVDAADEPTTCTAKVSTQWRFQDVREGGV